MFIDSFQIFAKGRYKIERQRRLLYHDEFLSRKLSKKCKVHFVKNPLIQNGLLMNVMRRNGDAIKTNCR